MITNMFSMVTVLLKSIDSTIIIAVAQNLGQLGGAKWDVMG